MPGFAEFWEFLEGLQARGGCPGCRTGGGYPDCQIRACARQRNLNLCCHCSDFPCEHVEALARESYVGARDLYEISCIEMEKMIQAMTSGPGVIGARQAGAGFGGCMVAFVHRAAVDAFGQHVQAHYQASAGIEPRVSPVAASAGAGVLDL